MNMFIISLTGELHINISLEIFGNYYYTVKKFVIMCQLTTYAYIEDLNYTLG